MTLDLDFLKAFTEIPSVGTACAPAMRLLKTFFGDTYALTEMTDGFCLFQKKGAGPEKLKVVFVAHVDEIGGCIYGIEVGDQYACRCWGTGPTTYAFAELQGWDYLSPDAADLFPIKGEVSKIDQEDRLLVRGKQIRPYRTVFTFKTETRIAGDDIEGKALDPRVTAYAVAEAVRRLNTPEVGAMIVMAEECAMDVARKGVRYLERCAPGIQLIANADVPSIANIGDGRLNLPAIRVFEGRNFIDPGFGIRTADRLLSSGVQLHLSAAKTGSQTVLFTPLAPTLSVALPSDGIHLPKYRMSLTGVERCVELLTAIGAGGLDRSLLD